MSTRWAGVFVVPALVAASAGAAELDGVYIEDRRAPIDIEGVPAPRELVSEPAPSGPLAVRLAWMDPARAAAGADGIARAETRALLKRMDVLVTWRIGEPGEVARPGEVRVILLDRAAARASGAPILGATPSHFEGAPFVWVQVPNLRATVGLRPEEPLATVDMRLVRAFGVALGRVVAHELVHVMAPSAPHGKGLMSEKLSRSQLTAGRLDVEPAVRLAVLAATTVGKKPGR